MAKASKKFAFAAKKVGSKKFPAALKGKKPSFGAAPKK